MGHLWDLCWNENCAGENNDWLGDDTWRKEPAQFPKGKGKGKDNRWEEKPGYLTALERKQAKGDKAKGKAAREKAEGKGGKAPRTTREP